MKRSRRFEESSSDEARRPQRRALPAPDLVQILTDRMEEALSGRCNKFGSNRSHFR
jgi:hypothetical protein